MLQNNPRYKMIVMDMDYTLLNKEKQVSKRNKEALRKAMEKGVHLVVATGRIYVSARFYAELLGIKTPIIASNGAIVKEEHTNKIIYQSILKDEIAKEMAKLCRQQGLYCHYFTYDTIYTEKLVNISSRYTLWNETLEDKDKINIKVVDRLEDIVKGEESQILKAVVVDSDEEKLKSIRDSIMEKYEVSVSQSLRNNLEVMNKKVSKGNAMEILCDLYGLKKEETMAIGDNENDLSMIEYAGMGVAMENAEEFVKQRANYITGNYQEDGVAQAIEKFVL